jgi:two-component system response regulator FixJ
MSKELEQEKYIHLVLHDRKLENQLTKFLHDYSSNLKVFNHISKFLDEPLSQAPACLITSLDLSEGDGLNLIKRVRSNGLSIPVVVVATADDDVYSAVKAMQAGAADFIQRPIMERDFIERIDKIVNKPD